MFVVSVDVARDDKAGGMFAVVRRKLNEKKVFAKKAIRLIPPWFVVAATSR